MWTKKNDHAPKSECVDFYLYLIHVQKGQFQNKLKFYHFLVFLGLHLSSLLVKCVEDVVGKSCHNNLFKINEQFNLYMFKVIYM